MVWIQVHRVQQHVPAPGDQCRHHYLALLEVIREPQNVEARLRLESTSVDARCAVILFTAGGFIETSLESVAADLWGDKLQL